MTTLVIHFQHQNNYTLCSGCVTVNIHHDLFLQHKNPIFDDITINSKNPIRLRNVNVGRKNLNFILKKSSMMRKSFLVPNIYISMISYDKNCQKCFLVPNICKHCFNVNIQL